MSYWQKNDFVIQNFLVGKVIVCSPLLLSLLHRIADEVSAGDIAALFSGAISEPSSLVSILQEAGLLVTIESELDHRERHLERWKWPIDARFFHFSSQNVAYEEDLPAGVERLAEYAKVEPAPAIYKHYNDVRRIALAAPECDRLTDVLKNRRTCRTFERRVLGLQELSYLLFWTWGKQEHCEDEEIGPYLLKTSPSGGARHPIEVYVAVLNVDSLENGLYHYSVAEHALELLKLEPRLDQILPSLCGNQPWVADASAIFFMTGVLERTMWKYHQSFAYRVLQLDAGHLSQTFCLACTNLGLASFLTGAMNARAVEEFLGIDGVSEIALFANVVGFPGPY